MHTWTVRHLVLHSSHAGALRKLQDMLAAGTYLGSGSIGRVRACVDARTGARYVVKSVEIGAADNDTKRAHMVRDPSLALV